MNYLKMNRLFDTRIKKIENNKKIDINLKKIY